MRISRESDRSYDPLAWVLRDWFYAQEANDALPLTNPQYYSQLKIKIASDFSSRLCPLRAKCAVIDYEI